MFGQEIKDKVILLVMKLIIASIAIAFAAASCCASKTIAAPSAPTYVTPTK